MMITDGMSKQNYKILLTPKTIHQRYYVTE